MCGHGYEECTRKVAEGGPIQGLSRRTGSSQKPASPIPEIRHTFFFRPCLVACRLRTPSHSLLHTKHNPPHRPTLRILFYTPFEHLEPDYIHHVDRSCIPQTYHSDVVRVCPTQRFASFKINAFAPCRLAHQSSFARNGIARYQDKDSSNRCTAEDRNHIQEQAETGTRQRCF